jgi:iron complex outermembrane receptor protein
MVNVMKFKFFIIICTILSCYNSFAQEIKNYSLDSIVVTANRVPSALNQVGRSIISISESEISSLPANNINDLVEIISGLDLKQRGPEGIQGDVSIRGGSFEQTLIMIDGIKLIDPQTGHHNMNIPISFSQIERIEILKGHGSTPIKT